MSSNEEFYTEAELVLLKLQLRNGIRCAAAAIRKANIELHPKIAALHAARVTPPGTPPTSE